MATEPCRERREEIGALVLGELSDSQALALRAHASECEGCRREIEALEPVAALLSHADPDRVAVATPPPPAGLESRLAQRLGAERRTRRRRRVRLAFAGATAALAAGVAAVALITAGDEGRVATTVAFDTGDPRVGLTATLDAKPWGTEVALAVRGIEEDTRCRVWLVGPDGERVAAGSFLYRYGEGTDAAELTSALPAGSVQAVEVKAGRRTYDAPLG
jgi:hypothetical protein